MTYLAVNQIVSLGAKNDSVARPHGLGRGYRRRWDGEGIGKISSCEVGIFSDDFRPVFVEIEEPFNFPTFPCFRWQ